MVSTNSWHYKIFKTTHSLLGQEVPNGCEPAEYIARIALLAPALYLMVAMAIIVGLPMLLAIPATFAYGLGKAIWVIAHGHGTKQEVLMLFSGTLLFSFGTWIVFMPEATHKRWQEAHAKAMEQDRLRRERRKIQFIN